MVMQSWWDALQRDAAGIGALADPVRHRLYEFVCSQPEPVSRDQAADATGIARHQAKFHLDRLEAEGLLESAYARVTGRSGPGAGRTSKLYRRANRQLAVSLPPREYELAGRLMARAIVESTTSGAPVVAVLNQTARDHGRAVGVAAVAASRRPPRDPQSALELAVAVLRQHGYEPRPKDGEVYLANCPFHALAQEQRELACTMNHAMISGIADAMRPYRPHARLDPRPPNCCVVLAAARRS
ncbi:transcriptional regulator [Mycobacterium heckeshornense]|uniref:helix-turn-helix transcriptional regulator n=1 Tax=Mycobacterium heckeshornense TaxID=110505 RepID=UPI001940E659|nr:helix-turn-helix domain-containing protein [Mycobacterium heckeshornense]BCQ09543.1 transcriptional regulator [Mycobacterium heckeshornense]